MLSLLRSFEFLVDNLLIFICQCQCILASFKKLAQVCVLTFSWLNPIFFRGRYVWIPVIWRFSGYRMDFGSGNRVSNCRSWDFLPFPTIGWCTWIVLFCTRVRNHAVNSNISFSPLPFGGKFFLDWHFGVEGTTEGLFWWMEYGIIMMGCGRGIPEGRDWKNAQGSRPLQVASSWL